LEPPPLQPEKWYEFMQHATSKWKQRKNSIYLHIFGAVITLATASVSQCSRQINAWLTIYLLFQAGEQAI
jgi:hypothetical protein